MACHVLGVSRLTLYQRELDPCVEELRPLEALLMRRLAREPLEYILGHCDFAGLDLFCHAPVLVPRPETELLVEMAARIVDGRRASVRLLDVGTGTGCIPLALLARHPKITALAMDIVPEALKLARRNSARHKRRIHLLRGRGENLPLPDDSLDLVTANLPYIPTDEILDLQPEIRRWESPLALDGGEDGLEVIRAVVPEALRVLRPEGYLFLEIGHGQGRAVVELLHTSSAWEEIALEWDLAGLERVVMGRKRS
jgi:release factor glutamine methyltransferase